VRSFGTALITGASSGIGEAIALQLAREGHDLVLVGRDVERLEAVGQSCRALGVACRIAAIDVRDRAAFADLVHASEADAPIDLFISNAGILDGRKGDDPLESAESAAKVLEVNLMAAIAALHVILPAMRARRRGRIVLVSSLAAFAPLADAPAYSASKSGLLAYGLALRDALRGEGLDITVACPGYVATRMGTTHLGPRPGEISSEAAAAKILKAAAKGRAICGFPFPLYWSARFSLFIIEPIRRLFTQGLRFHVGGPG
jgi:short-subunit dehydrogenase